MKKNYTYIIGIALALLAAGCGKEAGPQPWAGEGNITLAPGVSKTKALLSSADLYANGTRLKVYDYVTGYEGTVNGGSSHSKTDRFEYFSDVIEYDSSKYFPWKYVSENEYPWTKNGRHYFFGWVTYDAKSGLYVSDLLSSEPELSGGQLTVTHGFQTSDSQFDFSYSDIQAVDVEAEGFNPADAVPLNLHHLFSALCITFENVSSLPITINSIDIPAYPRSGSATIDYTGSSVVVEYSVPYADGLQFFNTSNLQNKTINQNEVYNVFTGNKDEMAYYLTWPVPRTVISPTTPTGEVIDEIPKYESTDSLIHVTYTSNGNTKEAKAKFPDEAIEAGKKYHVNVQVTNKQINVTTAVLPWQYTEHVLDFGSDAITTPSDGKLTVDPTSCTLSGAVARMITGSNIKCSLKIQTPVGATLSVGMKGDTDYFTVSPSTLTINEGTLRFEVCPSGVSTGGEDRSIQLSFTVVLPDGREIDADRELIDTNYTFVRQ